MHPRTSSSVFKYFDLADRFVRIRVAGPEEAGLTEPEDLDRRGYRRAVIAACVEGYDEEPGERLAALYPADPGAAEEVLYRLVVDVNPGLDIRQVALPGDEEGAEPATLRVRPSSDAGATRRTLARRADGLAQRLGARIFGQDRAIEAVVRAVRRAAAGLERPRGPLASLLLVGPTGTGKTELARELAQELGGEGPNGLLRIDCGELGQRHETSRLIGAPPGYVGFEDGGLLTEGLRQGRRPVVLFDEIEKAHPRLYDLLLSVLEEGELVDGKGRRVSFGDSIVLLTSNAGARESAEAARAMGFAPQAEGLADGARREIAGRALEQRFPPEFLGRLDEVIHFRSLDAGDARHIAARQLADLALRVRGTGWRMRWTEGVARWLARRGFGSAAGARGIAALVRREIEGQLADAMLGEERRGAHPWLVVHVSGGCPRVRREQP